MQSYMDEKFPPQNRFMVEFDSKHLLVRGGHSIQQNIRFYLADNAKQVKKVFTAHINDPYYWKPKFNTVIRNTIKITHCPEMSPWAGYCRFEKDIRDKKIELVK